MSRFRAPWGVFPHCPFWGVDYFASAQAAEDYEMTRETIQDFSLAEQRAAELGQTMRYVKLVGIRSEGGPDIFVAAYGTAVNHRPRRLREDPRGSYFCACGAYIYDDADLVHHHDLAGWPR